MPPAKGTDVKKFCQELTLGRHDDNLPALLEAFGGRIIAKSAKVRWRITLDLPDLSGFCVDEDNLTLLEMETAERLGGVSWLTLDPRQSAKKAIAVLTAALMHRHELTESEARERLSGLTAMQVAQSVSEYLSDADPFPSAGS